MFFLWLKARFKKSIQFSEKSKEIICQTNLIDYLKEANKYYIKEKAHVNNIYNWEIGEDILKSFRKQMLVIPQS